MYSTRIASCIWSFGHRFIPDPDSVSKQIITFLFCFVHLGDSFISRCERKEFLCGLVFLQMHLLDELLSLTVSFVSPSRWYLLRRVSRQYHGVLDEGTTYLTRFSGSRDFLSRKGRIVMIPQNSTELRLHLRRLSGLTPNTVVLYGNIDRGDFRGAIARPLTSCIQWVGVQRLVWRFVSRDGQSLGIPSESSTCRFFEHLWRTGIVLEELCIQLDGLPFSDSLSRQCALLIRCCNTSLQYCHLSFSGNLLMGDDAVMDMVCALGSCRANLQRVRLDFRGMVLFSVGIFSASIFATLFLMQHLSHVPSEGCRVCRPPPVTTHRCHESRPRRVGSAM